MTQTADPQSTEQVDPKFTGFPGSTKRYREGSRPDVRVPVREVELSPTTGRFGEEANPPVQLYERRGRTPTRR